MSTITYPDPLDPFAEYTSGPFHEEVRQWILDNPQDDSDYEPLQNWGGWNEKIHGNIIWKHSPETKKQISESHKGKRLTAETRAKMVKSHTGLKQSSETVEKRRLKLIGKKRTPEQRKRISESMKGKKLSEESLRLRRKKMSKWLIEK